MFVTQNINLSYKETHLTHSLNKIHPHSTLIWCEQVQATRQTVCDSAIKSSLTYLDSNTRIVAKMDQIIIELHDPYLSQMANNWNY